jgi:hypothetical protein
LGWRQLEQATTFGAESFQCVRRLSRRVRECLRFGFGTAFPLSGDEYDLLMNMTPFCNLDRIQASYDE